MSRWLPDVLVGPRGKSALKVAEYWWSYQHWYLNAATGNDFNDGATAGTALRTTEELSRRLAVSVPIDHPVTVHIAQGSYGTLAVRVIQTATACPFDVVGDVSYTDIGTVTSYTDRVIASNTASHLVASGVTDWTSHVGKRVDVMDGASAGAVAWVAKANPHALGVDVARTSSFALQPSGSNYGPIVTVSAASSGISLAAIPTLRSVQIIAQSGVSVPDAAFVADRKCGLFNLAVTHGIRLDADGALVDGCDISDLRVSPVVSSLFAATRSRISGMPGATSMNLCDVFGMYCLVQSPTSIICRLYRSQLSACLLQSHSALLWEGTLFDCGVFDRLGTSDAISLSSMTPRCGSISSAYGQGNARAGVSLASGATIVGAYGCSITGALGDVRLIGAASYVPWSALPWRDGERFGEATLVAGTVDVPVPYVLSTQKITACAKTFGGAPGFLSAVYVDATTIRITSSSATDTSVITWHILPVGDNAVIRS